MRPWLGCVQLNRGEGKHLRVSIKSCVGLNKGGDNAFVSLSDFYAN
jgi:hypothetical protein